VFQLIAASYSRNSRATSAAATTLSGSQIPRELLDLMVSRQRPTNWFTEGFDTADLKDAKAMLDELGG
jgi:hypothetical protein